MGTVNLNLDETLALGPLDPDVTTGIAKLGDDYVRVVHVVAANQFTVLLPHETPAEDALRLAAAIIEWDTGMMEAADAPFSSDSPKLATRQIIRSFLPKMHPCEFRDLFVDTYGYAGELRGCGPSSLSSPAAPGASPSRQPSRSPSSSSSPGTATSS
ncbi:hypothetical protein [Methylobacterium sp. WL2]|nr:hypothetical protein [Methylobacterium sp. WL2]QEE39913.1 hypothetical protein FVA80_14065 [Methylobacterium sp. WL1]TXN56579.1 hypothetical protein FV241_14720 [Methylobacterium sp. WL2]